MYYIGIQFVIIKKIKSKSFNYYLNNIINKKTLVKFVLIF